MRGHTGKRRQGDNVDEFIQEQVNKDEVKRNTGEPGQSGAGHTVDGRLREEGDVQGQNWSTEDILDTSVVDEGVEDREE